MHTNCYRVSCCSKVTPSEKCELLLKEYGKDYYWDKIDLDVHVIQFRYQHDQLKFLLNNPQFTPQYSNNLLKVSNIPIHVGHDMIIANFKQFGDVKHCERLEGDGFATIEMGCHEDLKKTIAFFQQNACFVLCLANITGQQWWR
ncbi:unnamed protein product [Caenorhabditis angaria]|uniref:Uncharacterized protein n=1 Tax=Caenorhabditis angaria TaxID=860376 RepID=A0A9P1I833_9PELO|nr:unnamed protein product [Caenorhabditis angaria]